MNLFEHALQNNIINQFLFYRKLMYFHNSVASVERSRLCMKEKKLQTKELCRQELERKQHAKDKYKRAKQIGLEEYAKLENEKYNVY